MPTHRDLPDDRQEQAERDFKALRSALRPGLAAFLIVVCVMLTMYCLWVLAEVSLGPADVQYQECSQIPVAQRQGLC